MIAKELTEKQSKFFRCILDYASENGVFPSYQAIMDETWLTSKNGVYQYLQTLCEKKYLRRAGWGGYEIHPGKTYLIDAPEKPIPIRGIIAAGDMQQAVESDLVSLSIRDLFPDATEPYSLRVAGDSMQEAGIYDGDLVILDKTELNNGEVGAVLYNGQTTLKEVYSGEDEVVLYPKNKRHRPIHLKPDEFEKVQVLGRYVAHIHRGRVCYID